MQTQQLMEELTQVDGADLDRRRDVILLSLAGMAAMTPVVLLQTGLVQHLPDPPVGNFHSDRVNLSEEAYKFGVPDGTLAMLSLAGNLVLAAFGGKDRAREQPWVPVAAAAKAAVDAALAGWYFHQMPAKEKAWCPYCITGALANFGIFLKTLPEAMRALSLRKSA
jgi:uncharacterized membrane protein